MFQYTKENILNSIPKIYASNGKINIEGLGEYVLENIVDKVVYVTPGTKGDESELTLTQAQLVGEKTLTFRVITPNQQLAEFASPNWNVFGKPIIVGYNATTLDDVKEAVKLAIPEGNKFITVEVSGSNLILKGATPYITFDKVAISTIDAEGKETVSPVELISEVADGKTVNYVKNVEPFATKEWIIENLRFPTYPNIRYASASAMPTADVYTEYAFTYRVPRVGLGGLSGVGQALDAVTRHIFYVPTELAASFEKGLSGLTFDKTVGKGGAGKEEQVTEDTHKPVDTTVAE